MIFISHATPDDEFVNRLVEELTIYGFSTWVDHQDMPPGSRWVKHLEKALSECDVMILVCSTTSMASSYVEAEWHTYFDMKKPVIPIRVDNCDIPPFLRTLHQIDFRDNSQFTENLQSLTSILGMADEKTIASRPVGLNTDAEDNFSDIDDIMDRAQYLMDEIAPTFHQGIMHMILPFEELVWSYPLAEELVIGRKNRSHNSGLLINFAVTKYGGMISREHAILRYHHGKLYVMDLGSTNGTYINGNQLVPNQEYAIDNYGIVHFSKNIPIVIRYQL